MIPRPPFQVKLNPNFIFEENLNFLVKYVFSSIFVSKMTPKDMKNSFKTMKLLNFTLTFKPSKLLWLFSTR